MKIVDVQVIPFRVPRRAFHNGGLLPEAEVVQTLTRIVTDEGAEGYYLGGQGPRRSGWAAGGRAGACWSGRIKPLLLGQDPFDREKFWHWLWVANVAENLISVLDMALWDLQARAFGLPVYKLLGGCRDKVKAYASTFPNMGTPEDYAEHAAGLQGAGLHALQDPPLLLLGPGDAAAGPRAALAHRVGHRGLPGRARGGRRRHGADVRPVGHLPHLRGGLPRRAASWSELNFYWYEHPMPEYRVRAYVKLCRELDIPICRRRSRQAASTPAPTGSSAAPSDMSRIDVLRGGITGVKKMAAIVRSVRRQVRDPHERLRQPADPGRHQRGHLRILRARAAAPRASTTRRRRPTWKRSATRWTPTAMSICRRSRGWAIASSGTTSRNTASPTRAITWTTGRNGITTKAQRTQSIQETLCPLCSLW